MDLLSIPSEVVDFYMLPHLGWNDLLRLRRTCKWTKTIVHGYLNVHPELAPEIEINEEDKTFASFMKMGIPTTKIFLNNTSGRDFFENCWEDAARFLDGYGLLVTSLRLDQISLYIVGAERNFLEATTSVLHFQAGRFGGYQRGRYSGCANDALVDQEILSYEYPQYYGEDVMYHLPSFFQRLKSVEIGNNNDNIITCWEWYHNDVLETGHSLTSVSLMSMPTEDGQKPPNELLDYDARDTESISIMGHESHIRRRIQGCPPGSQYEIIDFVSFHGYEEETQAKLEWMWSIPFLSLSFTCVERGVKLTNVGSNWFQERVHREEEVLKSPDLGIPTVSLVNLHPCVLSLNMPNLEGLDIQSTARSIVGVNWRGNRPLWASLKALNINVDSAVGWIRHYQPVFLGRPPSVTEGPTEDLFNFFFQDIRRINLTELCLQFNNQNETIALPVPNTEDIVSSCPNLKKLGLVKWPGSDAPLTKLWEGLPALEEVTLEECKELGNWAFIGRDLTSPAFLKLQKLKKLSLKGLEWMPEITDILLSQVIRHLKLTHLTLTSEAPIQSITLAGIHSLRDGSFAETIERFPFKTWSLAGVSAEEFEKEEAMFRSYNML